MTDILALDLATDTGICRGVVGGRPIFETISFAGNGGVFACALVWISDYVRKSPSPDLIAIEDTLPTTFTKGRTNKQTNDRLIGLAAIVQAVAQQNKIELYKHSVSMIRRHFIGTNDFPRKQAKLYTIAKCKELGWAVEDDNQADAAALWQYQCSLIDPIQGLRVSPLFNRRTTTAIP